MKSKRAIHRFLYYIPSLASLVPIIFLEGHEMWLFAGLAVVCALIATGFILREISDEKGGEDEQD